MPQYPSLSADNGQKLNAGWLDSHTLIGGTLLSGYAKSWYFLSIPHVVSIIEFFAEIGLACRPSDLAEPTFLPGLTIRNGAILYDESRLLYPGDLLHEAGHLAILPAAERAGATAPLNPDGGHEMAAIAWSYAAALKLALPVEVVFHSDGYKGGAESLIENFTAGRCVGVPLLEWAGLTATGARAEALGVLPYPHMVRWLREG